MYGIIYIYFHKEEFLMEMHYNLTSIVEICTSGSSIDLSVIFDKIIEKIFDEQYGNSLLKSLNENLHNFFSTEYFGVYDFNSSNVLREYTYKMSYKRQDITSEKLGELYELTDTYKKELTCFKSIELEKELRPFENGCVEILKEGALQLENNEIDELSYIGSLKICTNADVIVSVTPELAQRESLHYIDNICTGLTSLVFSAVVAMLVERSVKFALNALKYHVLSALSSKPQLSTVICGNVDVYKEKSSYSDKLGNLRYGEKVKIIGSSKDWYEVENMNTSDSWFSGYIPNRAVDYFIQ